ncbi:unnamed protein product [Ectocarpus sp. 12 AP-2014]
MKRSDWYPRVRMWQTLEQTLATQRTSRRVATSDHFVMYLQVDARIGCKEGRIHSPLGWRILFASLARRLFPPRLFFALVTHFTMSRRLCPRQATDLGWAPISSALIFYLYGNSIFAGLAFVEEILPGFDVIPTATIAWFLTNSEIGQNVTNAAAAKKPEGDVSSSAPPPPAGSPFSKLKDAREASKGAGSRKVDDGMVQSGVIDVDSED